MDILCKVVDNFGDIGVVYRLARALCDLEPALKLRLIVDDLGSFRSLCPAIDARVPVQEALGWTVVRWDTDAGGDHRAALAACGDPPPRLVIESFACGRPDWFEELLFDPGRPGKRFIVNLEYLCAEPWADDFHRMDSLTRSPLVAKRIFMPGFTSRTGGLILDRVFVEARERWSAASSEASDEASDESAAQDCSAARRAFAAASGLRLAAGDENRFWCTVFSYERDYSRIVADLAAWNRAKPLLALAAAGKSQACFLDAWEAEGRPFPVLALPFLAQETWDEVLLASDFAIVRGEESWARASLSGRPFLWQAYPQSSRHHLVKVRAFLDRLRPFLDEEDFKRVEALHLAFNDRQTDGPDTCGTENLFPLLSGWAGLEAGYQAFSDSLIANGDLARHLLTFLREIV